jgi:tight adherence protein C
MMLSALPFWVIGAAWGMLAARPLAQRAHRAVPVARLAALGARPHAPRPWSAWGERARHVVARLVQKARTGVVGRVARSFAVRKRTRAGDAELARELPVVLDLLGVAVGAGCTPYLAVEVAARWSPASIAAPLAAVLRACALGVSFDAALDDAARVTPVLRPVADALLASDRLGAPVGPVLARLADEERTALRRRAEANARRIPVRLLFPLVFLVLPAFVLLTVVPGLAAGLGRL